MTEKSCCGPKPVPAEHHTHEHDHPALPGFDPFMHGSILTIVMGCLLYLMGMGGTPVVHFVHSLGAFFLDMWWGVALGLISVGLMNKIPREYFSAVLGHGDKFSDILKAAFAGVVLDLCNHGILVISGKLYERGLSAAQVLTFLIASPWNSLSITFILIALIGLKWTLVFISGSVVVAVISGVIFQHMERAGTLPSNPHTVQLQENFDIRADAKERLQNFKLSRKWLKDVAVDGWRDGQMIIRWILFGTVVAAALRAFIPAEIFAQYFGPTVLGLGITLMASTLIEICSEGSAPIAAEILNTAHAPGNAFTFLMAGVATDYTEILVVRQFTKSWKIALALPFVTVPQILVLAMLMN